MEMNKQYFIKLNIYKERADLSVLSLFGYYLNPVLHLANKKFFM